MLAAVLTAVLAASAWAADPMLQNPCLGSSNVSSLPFCDSTLDYDTRAADAVGRLTTAEKISALGTATGALPSLNLPPYNWWSEATHGISHVRYTSETPFASNVALPITTSCSFNRTLWRLTGRQIGLEARAFMNAGNAYSTYWAPVINLVRDPRWGRNIETPGEDPFLTGEYAVQFVSGFEQNPEDPTHIQASACCKHFVANELENFNGTTRHSFNAIVTEQDLQDTYLPPFQACVERGRVSGIMCSYNAVNGKPSCANDWLLTTVLRQAWNFDGYVTSDCDADGDVFWNHHYTSTKEEAVADVLRAGTDVDCGKFVQETAQSALDKKVITMDDIDTVLKRLFRVRLRLGHFDPPGPLQKVPTSVVCSDYAKRLGRDGALQGTVMLKNANKMLPLAKAAVKSVAVIGPNGELCSAIAKYYAGTPCDNVCDTVVSTFQQAVGNASVVFQAGLSSVTDKSTKGFAAAVAAAEAADLVVLAIGQDGTIEHEGKDRLVVAIQDGQLALIEAVTKAAKTPVLAVILTAGAVDVSPLLSNDKVGAILDVGQPSTTIIALQDLVFGAVSPSGRMVQTTYPADFVNQVSLMDMNMRPGKSAYPPFSNPGRTYRFFTKTAVLPFGFGLSYTTWQYTVLPTSTSTASLAGLEAPLADFESSGGSMLALQGEDVAGYYVNVTNTGDMDADDVVLGFLTPPGAGEDGVPLKQLFGFERVHVKAKQTVTVYLGAQGWAFTQVRPGGKRVAWPGTYTASFGVHESTAAGMAHAEASTLALA